MQNMEILKLSFFKPNFFDVSNACLVFEAFNENVKIHCAAINISNKAIVVHVMP